MTARTFPSESALSPVVPAAALAIYFALGRVGLALGGFSGPASAFWPASGFALAAVLIFGRRIWPGLFAGSFIVYAMATGEMAASIAVACGTVLEACLGAALIERFAGGVHAFERAETIFRAATIVALVGTPIGAAFGAAGLAMAHASPLGEAAYSWMNWWLMDLSGVLVVSPFVLLWTTGSPVRFRWRAVLEASVLFALLIAVGVLVFDGRFPSDVKDYPLEFLCGPFLLWAAFRLGCREMATVILLLSGIAIWGTLRGFGPFVRYSLNEGVVLVQAYVSLTAIMGGVLAAAVAEHRRAEAQLEALATTDSLTGLVNYRRLLDAMRTEIARSQRTGRSFALLFIDMNGLKRINDRYGHLAGSRAICRVADALRQSCRTIDTPGRYGGDEFAVLLPESEEEGGQAVFSRVSDRLAQDADKPLLSVSGGVAVFPRDGATPTLLLRAADAALYEAKARVGRARKPPAIVPEHAPKAGMLF